MANGHGGARPNSGGARPGAGRKKKVTENIQQANRDLILEWTTPEDVRAVFSTALAGAKAGRPEDRKWLTPFWFGNPEHVVNLNSGGQPLRFTINIGGPDASGDSD